LFGDVDSRVVNHKRKTMEEEKKLPTNCFLWFGKTPGATVFSEDVSMDETPLFKLQQLPGEKSNCELKLCYLSSRFSSCIRVHKFACGWNFIFAFSGLTTLLVF